MVSTEVTAFLDEQGFDYEILDHKQEALTSEEAADMRGVPLDEMIKTMVFLNDDRDIVLASVPAHKRVDLAAFKEVAGIKSLKFADEEIIEDQLGYIVGAIPPFIPSDSYPIYMDSEIFWNSKVNFSSGRPDAGVETDLSTFREIMTGFDSEKRPISKDPE